MKLFTYKKTGLTFLSFFVLLHVALGQTTAPAIPTDPQIEKKIDRILSKMTLEEKVGQMTQLDINLLLVSPWSPNFSREKGIQFEPAILDTVFAKYKVGSILNTPFTMAQDAKTWNGIMQAIQEKSMKETGLPCLFGLDQIHGSTYVSDGTLFPQGINMAATFNRALARRSGEITAYQTRAAGIPWTFGPVLDMGRQPAWPRQWEGFGEDCYLSSEIGREVVKGLQGDDPNHIGKQNIAACLKHYFGYGVPFNGLDRTSAIISPQDMREKQFAPFLEALQNGALSVMTNSSTVNGQSGVASHLYLTQWLKDELHWDGMVVTDWADITSLYERDHIASSYKEAVMMTINAGVDMAMVPSQWQYCIDLKELVEEGKVPMSRIDDAVRRVLRLKFRVGLFDNLYTKLDEYPAFNDPSYAQLSLQAAQESIVLLKNNDNTLPIKKDATILVTGPNANTMRALNGGWSYTWQGSNDPRFVGPFNTILEAMQNKYGTQHIIYEPGVTYNDAAFWTQENTPNIDAAVAAAQHVDYIVACIGENSYCETTGNIPNILLSPNQTALVKALAATGKPLILVLNEGRPRVIADLVPLAHAIVDVMLPGSYGGDALADLLAGDANFSGRLSITYPSSCNGLTTYDFKVCEVRSTIAGVYDYSASTNIQWPFGYGLSYTTFAYSNLKANKTSFTANDTLTFTVTVTNTGNVAGQESVLLYSTDLYASIMPDNRRLRAFEKIALQPGESKEVTLHVKGSDMAFVGADAHWVLEQGDFRFAIGNQAVMIPCAETYRWETPNR